MVDPVAGRPRFEDDPEFDIDQHLHLLALPAPGDRAALQDLVSDLITPPLDSTRPLWHAYLIEGYEGGCAVLFRIHHCIADGIALARVMLSLTDAQADAGIEPAAAREERSHGALGSLLRPAGAAISTATPRRHGGRARGPRVARPPAPRWRAGEDGGADAATLAKLLTVAPGRAHGAQRDPSTARGTSSWSKPFPLDRIRAAARRADGTINDVLVAASQAPCASYLRRAGQHRRTTCTSWSRSTCARSTSRSPATSATTSR